MTTPDVTSRLDTALSLEAARDLASMPYTPPEVILRHVGPLWRAYCAQLEALAAERAENARLRKSLAFFAARFLAVAPRHEGSGEAGA